MEDKQTCKPNTKEHRDALRVVEYMMDKGGVTTEPNQAIAVDLGFWRSLGGGYRKPDMDRFYRARNHARDRQAVDDEGNPTGPCCGYQLDYRKDGRTSILALIDSTGDLGDHKAALIGSVSGWATRDRQHKTETRRHQRSIEALGNHALANGDRDGYRLCQKATIEIDEFGAIRDTTLAELIVWMESVS